MAENPEKFTQTKYSVQSDLSIGMPIIVPFSKRRNPAGNGGETSQLLPTGAEKFVSIEKDILDDIAISSIGQEIEIEYSITSNSNSNDVEPPELLAQIVKKLGFDCRDGVPEIIPV